MLMANLFSSGASHIHILPQFCNDSACRLVCQRQRYSARTAKASPKVDLLSDIYLPMESSDRNCVVFQTNRARCALNKKFLNLLNEESISGEKQW